MMLLEYVTKMYLYFRLETKGTIDLFYWRSSVAQIDVDDLFSQHDKSSILIEVKTFGDDESFLMHLSDSVVRNLN